MAQRGLAAGRKSPCKAEVPVDSHPAHDEQAPALATALPILQLWIPSADMVVLRFQSRCGRRVFCRDSSILMPPVPLEIFALQRSCSVCSTHTHCWTSGRSMRWESRTLLPKTLWYCHGSTGDLSCSHPSTKAGAAASGGGPGAKQGEPARMESFS